MTRSRSRAARLGPLALAPLLGCSVPASTPRPSEREAEADSPASASTSVAAKPEPEPLPPLPDFVRDVFEKRDNELRACYEAAARVDEDLQGTVTFRVEISAEGKVTAVEALDGEAFGAPRAVACMERGIGRWRFDVPEGGGPLEVRHRFEFSWD